MSLPSVVLTGNLVEEPTIKFAANGTAVAKFRVAASERRKNPQTNEWEDGAICFIGCVTFKNKAEALADSQLTKGTAVTVVGKLVQNSWETKEGEKRSTYEIRVDEVAAVIKPKPVARSQPQSDPWGAPTPAATGAPQSQGDPWDSSWAPANAPDDPPPF